MQREELRRIPQVPFAEYRRRIAALFHQLSQGHFIIADADLRTRPQRPMNAEPIRIASRQQRRARRRADGLGDVEIAEDSTLAGEPIEVGRLEPFGAEHADVGVALVIGEDDNDVGQGARFGSERGDQTDNEKAERR